MSKHYITGNTFPVKDQLRQLGCRWDAGRKAWYTEDAEIAAKAAAIVQPHPLYNSPPPQDLGTTDPAASAAKFGRHAVDGAKIVSFSVYGLAKGEGPQSDGSIRRVKGKRYVQIAHTPRRYLSRDWLEDMDMFSAAPGGSYQWDGVEIEPTADEIAADAKAVADKEAKERPIRRRAEIVRLVQTAANGKPNADFTGLAYLWGDSRMAGSELLYGDAERLIYRVSSYDDGPYTWELRDPAIAQEALTLRKES
jgi:hypothetical protein